MAVTGHIPDVEDPLVTVSSMDSDEDARFNQLYRRHHTANQDYCKRRVPDEMVDDVVAEVFLTAWRRLDDVPEGDATGLWLYRVAYRVVGHQWRGVARQRRLRTRLGVVVPRPAPRPTRRSSVVKTTTVCWRPPPG